MKILLSLLITIFIFNGCSNKEDNSFVQSIFQTNGAVAVREQTDILRDFLLIYKEKLDKRNPNHYSKKDSPFIINEIKYKKNRINFELLKDKKGVTYKDYLNIAFDKNYVKNRNDYLILGIYKMLYWAYTIDRTHTITTMQYDINKLQEANKMMQIIQYRVQTAKNKDGNYLFLTWQRQWQVEVLKKINQNKEINLSKYTNKQLLYHSNMNFQVISSKMIFTVQETLRYLGVEEVNLSAQAIKSVFMFL